MTKKESSRLGLSPLPQASNGVVIYGAVAHSSRVPSQAEQWIVLETEKQIQVIHNQRTKADVAAQQIAQMHQQAAQEFQDTVSALSTLKDAARGKEYAPLVEEFVQRSAQLAAQHLFGITEVSARNIGMETARPLYREEEPPVVRVVERPGLLRRLIGA